MKIKYSIITEEITFTQVNVFKELENAFILDNLEENEIDKLINKLVVKNFNFN